MRMSEVFALPVYSGTQEVHIINKEKPCVVSGTSTVLVARPKYIEAVIHAVNNHDRLVDENAKLRKMLVQLQTEGGLGIARHRQIDRLLSESQGEPQS